MEDVEDESESQVIGASGNPGDRTKLRVLDLLGGELRQDQGSFVSFVETLANCHLSFFAGCGPILTRQEKRKEKRKEKHQDLEVHETKSLRIKCPDGAHAMRGEFWEFGTQKPRSNWLGPSGEAGNYGDPHQEISHSKSQAILARLVFRSSEALQTRADSHSQEGRS